MCSFESELIKPNLEDFSFSLYKSTSHLDSDWEDYNQLNQALRNGHKEIIKLLIQKGARVNKSHSIFPVSTPLHLAVNLGCPEIVSLLLDKGAFTEKKNHNEETPLIMATKMRRYAIVDILLSVDDQMNCCSKENLTHMHIACMRNRVDIVKKLVQNGARINHAVKLNSLHWPGYTPLHFAVEFHCIETVRFLLSCGADITIKEAKQLTPLHLADLLRNETIIDMILSAHQYETVNPVNLEGLSHFHIACTRDNPKHVGYFLKQGVNVNIKVIESSLNWTGFRPINFAIFYECIQVIKLLLLHNASLNLCDLVYTPIQYAYKTANREIIDLLLSKHSIKKEIPLQLSKVSDLYVACMQDNVDKIRSLICQGDLTGKPVNLNHPSYTGCTPLHLAIKHKSLRVIEFLLVNGAEVNLKNARGKTSLHLAFESKQVKIVDLILTNHLNFQANPTDNNGLSHFHISCMRNKLRIIRGFLKHEVNVNDSVNMDSPFWPGYTPLHFAVEFEYKKLVDELLKHNADITVKNKCGFTPLDTAIYSTDSTKCWRDETDDAFAIIDLILTASFFNGDKSFNNRGFSSLHIFSINNDVNAIENHLNYLPETINQSITWSSSDWFGYTPLHFAVHFGSKEAAELLIKKGADISIKNGDGNTPLHVVFGLRCHLQEVQNPELSFVSENPTGEEGYSHFHIACSIGNLEAVKYFVDRGIDVNQPTKFTGRFDYNGETPLHLAVSGTQINEELIDLLLKRSANVHAVDAELNTPLHCTKNNSTTRAMEMLVNHGADVEAQNMYGETPLYTTCFDCDLVAENALPEKISYLLEVGANVNKVDEENLTPIMVFDSWTDSVEKFNCVVVLLKHIKKLKIINFHINKQNEQAYLELSRNYEATGRFRELDFVEHCLKELNLLKTKNIDKYTTLYNILFKNLNEMALHSANVTFQKLIDSAYFKKKFPIYGPVLKLQLRKGLERRPLLETSKDSLHFFTAFPLPDACSEKILQHLNNEDLKNLILSRKI